MPDFKLTATARTLELAAVARHCVALKHSQHPGRGAIDNGDAPKISAMILACRRRQVNNRLALTPWHCATLDTDAPGAVLSATIRRFSSLDQKRRRRKPVGFVALSAKSQFISIVSTIVDGHYIVPLFAHYRSPRPSVPGGPRRRLTFDQD